MSRVDFVKWHERMNYTYVSGAKALGVSRAAYANYLSGVRRDSGTPVHYDRKTALACAALESGIKPLGLES
jgi:predicted transcriptional regulator